MTYLHRRNISVTQVGLLPRLMNIKKVKMTATQQTYNLFPTWPTTKWPIKGSRSAASFRGISSAFMILR